MKILLNWVLSAIAILIVAYILPGVSVNGFVTALILAVVLGIINAIIKPILFILILPITIVTLGLFTLVINAVLVILATWIVPGFTVANIWWAMLFALLLSLVNSFFHSLEKKA